MPAQPPIFLGSASGLVPLEGATLSRNQFGVDVLQRPYHLPSDKYRTLLPAKGSRDIRYGGLFSTGSFTLDEGEGLSSRANVEYKGFLDGVPTEPLKSDGFQIQSTNIVALYSSEGSIIPGVLKLSVNVRCPYTDWKWSTSTKPTDEPPYKDITSTASPWEHVVSTFIVYVPGVTEFVGQVFDYLRSHTSTYIERVESYNRNEVVPGKIWECSCRIMRQPIPEGTIINIGVL